MPKSQVTMADIAKRAQVSKMSVSRALNGQAGVSEASRQRIMEAVAELGYNPLPPVGTRRTNTRLVALLISNLISSYFGELLQGVASAAERLNYGLILCTQNISEPNNQNRPLLSNVAVDGVLLITPRNYAATVEELNANQLPYIIIDHHSGAENEPSVTATNRNGILDAMRHLLALGHQRIGFITGRMDIACSHDRLQGYRDGLAEVGLPFDPELVCEGDYSQPAGFHLSRHLLLQPAPPPTAIIASNDVMAFGAMDAAKELGLSIGSDISIIGFDDIYMASQVYPALTTVRQPLAEMGEIALEMLMLLLQEQPILNLRRELPTKLIIRESTGRPPLKP